LRNTGCHTSLPFDAQVPITLEISAKDAALLALIRDELVPGGAITQRQRKGYTYHILAFVSRQMVSALENLGVGAAKSKTLMWPTTLPVQYNRQFILGYFDGDGFVTYHQRGAVRYPYLGFTSGSSHLLTAMADVIERQVGVRPQGPWLKTGSSAYVIRASGMRALAIDQWLHSDELGLRRKRLDQSYGRSTDSGD